MSLRSSLKRRIHPSWHIAWISGGILVGAGLSPLIGGSAFTSYAWLVIAGSLILVSVTSRAVAMVVLSLIAGLLVGAWRGSVERSDRTSYQWYYNQVVTLSGRVSEDTSYGPKGDQRLRVDQVQIDRQSLPGTLWVSTSAALADIKRGDNLIIKGVLSEGFGNIPASMFRAEVVAAERPYPGDVGRRVRDWFAGGMRQAIPEPEVSLGAGYLVGQRSTLPEELNEQLRVVGLTHVIVASGYNLTILVSITRRLFVRISKYLATLSASVLIGGFVAVTGLTSSMARAGLVAALGLAAWYYGRKIHPLVLLPVAAAITVLCNPAYLWGDIGWYLSFTSFAGVLLLAPLVHHFFWGSRKRPGVLREIVVGTIAAQIASLPIILFVFGESSIYALPANLLVLPLIPVTMLLTFLGGVAGLVVPGLASWLGIPATAILQYMIAVVEWIADLPGARGEVVFGPGTLVAGYGLLALLLVLLWLKTKHNFRNSAAETDI